MVFSLPFIGAGLFVFNLGVRTWREAERAKAWQPVDVVLHEATLEANPGKESASHTYQLKARYSYEVNGQTFESDRVSFHTGADSFGTWHQDHYAILKQAHDTDDAFKAYVNPADPAEAVLFPKPRMELLYFEWGVGGVFLLVGLGMFLSGVRGLFGGGSVRNLKRQYPAEPWRWREDWAAGMIRSHSRKQAIGTLIFAIMWLSISTIAAAGALLGGNKPPLIAILLVTLFEGIGLALIIWAVRDLRVAKRYGGAVLHLTSTPGVIGGTLAGVITLPDYAEPNDAYRIELACERTVRSGKRTRRVKEWARELLLDPKKLPARRDGVQIPVLFAIPYGLPPSEYPVTWTLRMRAKQPGVDVDVPFTVPVFVTAESRPDYVLDDSGIRPYLLETRAI